MLVISDWTPAMAVPMLPVESTTSTMSGLGGMVGVVTVFVTWIESPGLTESVTGFGVTPAMATAGEAAIAAVATIVSAPLRIPLNTVVPLLGRSWRVTEAPG